LTSGRPRPNPLAENYYILGSAIEIALLTTIVYYAWTWPKENPPSTTGREVTPHDIQPTAP